MKVFCSLKELESIIIFAIIPFLCIFIVSPYSHANDDDGYSWTPRFYNGTYQEERNVCLGILIPEEGLAQFYSVSRNVMNEQEETAVFEGIHFSKENAIASVKTDFIDDNGDKIIVYLMMVPDVCLPDENIEYNYILYDMAEIQENLSYLSVENIDFQKTERECDEFDQDICKDMDLTEFYSWEAEEDDDDTPEPDHDNDDTNSSDDDNDDDECGCGCDVSGRATSFPLALFMFAIGIAAWAISRRTRNK